MARTEITTKRPELAHAESCVQKLDGVLDVLPLATQADEQQAARLLRAIETVIGRLEKARKEEKEPHLQAGRAVDDSFKTPSRALSDLSEKIRRRLADAAAARENERLSALQIASTADPVTANAALATIREQPSLTGVSERWNWTAVSFQLSAMPVEYLMVDMGKIRAHIADMTSQGKDPSLPGVTFERTVSHVVRKL